MIRKFLCLFGIHQFRNVFHRKYESKEHLPDLQSISFWDIFKCIHCSKEKERFEIYVDVYFGGVQKSYKYIKIKLKKPVK